MEAQRAVPLADEHAVEDDGVKVAEPVGNGEHPLADERSSLTPPARAR
jgi:hypothetical protein